MVAQRGTRLWLGLRGLSREFISLRGLSAENKDWGVVAGVLSLPEQGRLWRGATPCTKSKSSVNGFITVLRETRPGDQNNNHRPEQVRVCFRYRQSKQVLEVANGLCRETVLLLFYSACATV